MSITSGTRLGPYEIQSLIGSGGMGEVYRAIDTRLQRSVAIKVLPSALAGDKTRLARFEQEARAIAALNHPNVLVAHDTGIFDGAPFVVSELLEGATLRQFIREGPLPTRAVLDYGQQMAKGLAAAHERGIVHRDLKPENVFVTRDGRVKILDFGLAKLRQPDVPAATAQAATQVETEAGVVLGTVGYMSPEQVRGLDTDHRSDIFSLGAILYEMMAGRRAFHGPTRADTMTAILKEEPPESTGSGRHLPPALVRIVARCLEKMPERRFQSASDLAFALEAGSSTSGSELTSASRATAPTPRRYGTWLRRSAVIGGAAVLLAAVPFVARLTRSEGPEPIPGRFTLILPAGVQFASAGAAPGPRFALSPDGKSVAVVAQTGLETAVWLRALDAAQPVKVTGTEGVTGTPFWSPDGKSLAFFTQSGLAAIDLPTGRSRTICDARASGPDADGAWGTSVIVTTTFAGFSVCPVAGGTASPQFVYAGPKRFPVPGGRPSHPRFLPDGQRFIFAMRAPDADYNGVFLGVVADAPRVDRAELLLEDRSVATYAAGHLLFVREGVLMAQPFDPATATLSSQPRAVTRSVEFEDGRAARLSASGSVLMYTTGEASRSELRWAGSQGAAADLVVPAGDYGDFSLSPDGSRIAIVRRDAKLNLRVVETFDLRTGERRRLSGPAGGSDSSPIWSPDGATVAFSRHSASRSSLVTVPADGGRETELLVDTEGARGNLPSFEPLDWSSNPSRLIYRDGMNSLWVLPLSGEPRTPTKIDTNGLAFAARFAPDGKWIAYAGAGTSLTVYIEPWPQTGRRWAVSGRDGGTDPRWGPGGRQLFYRSAGNIMVVDFPVQGPPATATPRSVASVAPGEGLQSGSYAVAPDGRLLIRTAVERQDSIVTLLNWTKLVEE